MNSATDQTQARIEWSIVVPIFSISVVTIVYYYELGFFISVGIPTELMRVQIIDFVKSAAFIIAAMIYITLGIFLYNRCVHRSVKLPQKVRRLFQLGFFTLIAAIFQLIIFFHVSQIKYMSCITILGVVILFINLHKQKNTPIQTQSSIENFSTALILLSWTSIFSFNAGYYKWIDDGRYFGKKGTNQVLIRKYSDYSIYQLSDSNTHKQKLIVIQYNGNNADTLVAIQQKSVE